MNDTNDKEKFLDIPEYIKNNSDKSHMLSISNTIDA